MPSNSGGGHSNSGDVPSISGGVHSNSGDVPSQSTGHHSTEEEASKSESFRRCGMKNQGAIWTDSNGEICGERNGLGESQRELASEEDSGTYF